MKTITVYSPAELKAKFPDAFEYAHSEFAKNELYDILWTDEIMKSLKGLFKTAGINLRDWSISAEGYRSYIKFTLPSDVYDYTGKKACIWIKANVLGGAKFERVTYDKCKGGKGRRYDITKRDGSAWSCEFTGYCADDDFVDSLLDDIRSGCTLEDAFLNLANCAAHLFENERDYVASDEYFLEQDHLQYTEEGRQI